MRAETEFDKKMNEFSVRLNLLDSQFREFLNTQKIEKLESCFQLTITHNTFGLPCFRLRVKEGLIVPEEIKKTVQALFKQHLGKYAV